jgi:hypothetical protein
MPPKTAWNEGMAFQRRVHPVFLTLIPCIAPNRTACHAQPPCPLSFPQLLFHVPGKIMLRWKLLFTYSIRLQVELPDLIFCLIRFTAHMKPRFIDPAISQIPGAICPVCPDSRDGSHSPGSPYENPGYGCSHTGHFQPGKFCHADPRPEGRGLQSL